MKIFEKDLLGIKLEKTSVVLSNGETRKVFFPSSWSEISKRVVTEKYFHRYTKNEIENNIYEVAERMVSPSIEYFFNKKDEKEILQYTSRKLIMDLIYLIITQKFAPNSPTWFNVGIKGKTQQSAACFVINVDDSLVEGEDSIMAGLMKESKIFKRGSGSGFNVSNLRAKEELLGVTEALEDSGYGTASGPISFMKVFDVNAGVIKSAGEARRAACMRICDVWHLDIEEYIDSKVKYEEIGHKMIANNIIKPEEMQDFLPLQNANHCVRLTRDFLKAVYSDSDWQLHGILKNPNGSYRATKDIKARDLFKKIVSAIWKTGEPTIQFADAINDANVCSHIGEIKASNPCSEYMWFENTSCNLGSINLASFYSVENHQYNIDSFLATISAAYIFHHSLVSYSDYPTDKIKEESNKYRNIGLGYSNLGGLLMLLGLPYESHAGRAIAGLLTSIMTGMATLCSFNMAKIDGPYVGFSPEHHFEVLNNQITMAINTSWEEKAKEEGYIDKISEMIDSLIEKNDSIWNIVAEIADHGGELANAQLTLLAPTGTTRFSLGAVTTGVEPEYSLSYQKRMVDGTTAVFINDYLEKCIKECGVDNDEVGMMIDYIKANGDLFGYEYVSPVSSNIQKRVFNTLKTAAAPHKECTIEPIGHVKMIAAIQPFLSGSISKTVNVPADCTEKEISQLIISSSNMDLKSISFFRDGCKSSMQPIVINKSKGEDKGVSLTPPAPQRKAPPGVANAKRVKVKINDASFGGEYPLWIQLAEYEDGSLAEVWITGPKEGNLSSGLFHSISILMSYLLQLGVSPEYLVEKFKGMNFTPSGYCSCTVDGINFVSSPIDAIVKVIEHFYCNRKPLLHNKADIKYDVNRLCVKCEHPMYPDGKCWVCPQCGENQGGCSS